MSEKSQIWFKYAIDYGEYDPIRSGSIDGTDTEPHDRAIVRAINSAYTPVKNVKGCSANTLFVGRLNVNTDESKLQKEFGHYGKIVNCIVIRDIKTKKSRRYAFVEFEDNKSAKKAYKEMHLKVLDESEIIVEFEFGRTLKGWKPRRLGGGFGGRKESGQLRFGGRTRPFQKPLEIKIKPTNFKEIYRLRKTNKIP